MIGVSDGNAGGGVVGGGLVGVDGLAWGGNDDLVVGGGDGIGLYLRRNLRFLVVSLPEPSVLTAYWLYCRTSRTVPVCWGGDLSGFVP